MKQKRILAAILAALMACPVFVSCAETPKNEKETFLAESSHESEEDTYVHDNLPEDFVCPLCKHGAADFEEIQ